MMPRRSFLARSLLGVAGIAAMPVAIAHMSCPSLWIAESEPSVAAAIRLLAQRSGFAAVRVFTCKRTAIKYLRTEFPKPTLLVTDYWNAQMQGDEFVRLARQASPQTKVILFSGVVGNFQQWTKAAGVNALRPHAFVEKPNSQELITAFCQSR